MRYTWIFCLGLWLAATTSYAQDIHWLKLSGDNYSIQYPEDWQVNESGMMGTEFFLFAPPTSADDEFSENLNYIVIEVGNADGITAEQFAESTIAQIGQVMSDPILVDSDEVTLNGQAYLRVEYTAVQNGNPLHFLQYAHFKGTNMHLLTFTAPIDGYKDYEELAEEMIATFKVK